MKNTVFSTNMLVSICIGVFLLTWNYVFNLIIYNLAIGSLSFKDMGSIFLDDIYNAHARSGFDLFAPILAVLPATTLFCEDYNSGYIKSILGRAEKKRYISETTICSTIAGGLAIFIPSLISSFLYIANGKLNTVENRAIDYSTVFDETVFSKLQFVWDGLLLVILLLLLSFLFGAIWSNIGLCISAMIPNRYIALAAPFAVYFATHLIFYRIGFLLVLSPVNTLMPTATFIPNMAFPFVYQAVLFIIVAFACQRVIERRLKNV